MGIKADTVYVLNKNESIIAVFNKDDEDTLINPEIQEVQNSEAILTFQVPTASEKWTSTYNPENLYLVEGKMFSANFSDSIDTVLDEDGTELVTVVAYERQKLLSREYVRAWNSETGFENIDEFMVVILSGGDLDLKNNDHIVPTTHEKGTSGYVLDGLLYGTGWKTGICDVEGVFDFESDLENIYDNILKVQETWGGIFVVDSLNKIISHRDETKFLPYTGFEVKEEKNLQSYEYIGDNKIITMLCPLGEGSLNIKSVNEDSVWLTNFSYTDTVYKEIINNADIYEPEQLKRWGERKLLELCHPRKELKVTMPLLHHVEGFELEEIHLNDIVDVTNYNLEEDKVAQLRVIEYTRKIWSDEDAVIELGDITLETTDIFKKNVRASNAVNEGTLDTSRIVDYYKNGQSLRETLRQVDQTIVETKSELSKADDEIRASVDQFQTDVDNLNNDIVSQSRTLAELILRVGEITSKVETIADLTETITGKGKVVLDDAVDGYLLGLSIHGYDGSFKATYLDDNTVISDDLYVLDNEIIFDIYTKNICPTKSEYYENGKFDYDDDDFDMYANREKVDLSNIQSVTLKAVISISNLKVSFIKQYCNYIMYYNRDTVIYYLPIESNMKYTFFTKDKSPLYATFGTTFNLDWININESDEYILNKSIDYRYMTDKNWKYNYDLNGLSLKTNENEKYLIFCLDNTTINNLIIYKQKNLNDIDLAKDLNNTFIFENGFEMNFNRNEEGVLTEVDISNPSYNVNRYCSYLKVKPNAKYKIIKTDKTKNIHFFVGAFKNDILEKLKELESNHIISTSNINCNFKYFYQSGEAKYVIDESKETFEIETGNDEEYLFFYASRDNPDGLPQIFGKIYEVTDEPINLENHYLKLKNPVNVEPNSQMYFSLDNGNYEFINLYFYDSNKNYIGNWNNLNPSNEILNSTEKQLIIPQNAYYMNYIIKNKEDVEINPQEIVDIKPQLEYGDRKTEFIECNTQRYEFLLDDELREMEVFNEETQKSETVFDEFTIIEKNAELIRRIGVDSRGNKYVLTDPKYISYGEVEIPVVQGQNIIQAFYYTPTIIARYVKRNQYTDLFATKAEVSTVIQQTDEKIFLSASKKISKDELIQELNSQIIISPEIITIEGDKIKIKSSYFELTHEGEITATRGKIAGWDINENSLTKGLAGIRAVEEPLSFEEVFYVGKGLGKDGNSSFAVNSYGHVRANSIDMYSLSNQDRYPARINIYTEEEQVGTNIDANTVESYNIIAGSGGSRGQCMHGLNEEHIYRCHWDGTSLKFYIDQSGQSYVNPQCWIDAGTSDLRLKNNIEEINNNIFKIFEEINIKEFILKTDEKVKIRFGIIAQELIQISQKYNINLFNYNIINKSQIIPNDDTEYYTINYNQLLLIKEKILENKIKKQDKIIDFLIKKLGYENEIKNILGE